MEMPGEAVRVAVVLPCHNEAMTIADVVRDFGRHLPDATVYVFDNNSTDDTAARARAAGAVVRDELLPGKGNVVRRMFADVDADVYVLADGDATYDAADAPAMVQRLLAGRLDMVVGARVSDEGAAYRSGHRFGNRVLTGVVGFLFGRSFTDMLSGYRVLSRRFVKSFPAHASGFETETELTVHALELRMPVAEQPSRYRTRPHGSESKLRTWSDGARILLSIFKLLKDERPLLFFSTASFVTAAVAIGLGVPLVGTWLHTGLVPRFPTAILCAAMMVMAVVFLVCGLILDTVSRGRREVRRIAYLSIPPAGPGP
jgi:glycosyltransferase involved in cell wall biosynthesis